MSGFVSNTTYDSSNILRVSVIASFDIAKHIKPLYVRISSESFKIYSSYEKQSFQELLEFQCQIIDGDLLKPLTITYHKHENIWTIPRIYSKNN